MFDVGVDLAWGVNSPTGLAAVDPDGVLVEACQVRTDAEIVSWLARFAADAVLVAIDAPIVVVNPTGARACERLVGRYFSRYNASCHSANTSNPAFAAGTRAGRLAQALGLDVDPASSQPRRALEVYPHPALVSLFDLPTVLTYKDKPGRDLHHLKAELGRLLDLIETLKDADVPLDVTASRDWQRIRQVAAAATGKAQLRSVEDSVDAVVCAYIARYSRHWPDRVRVLGDVDTGYILTPVTADIAAAIDSDRAAGFSVDTAPARRRPRRPSAPPPQQSVAAAVGLGELLVEFAVEGRPASFATAAESAWKAAVSAAVADSGVVPRKTRFGVEIEFRTPAPTTTNEVWDIDNLVKPVLDAMAGVLGARPGAFTVPQADDERVDYLLARKRTVAPSEQPGALIRVYDLASVDGSQPDSSG